LRRDRSGNYGYVYTADESKIDEAQSQYDEALFNYQDWSYNQEQEQMDLYLNVLSEYQNSIQELKEKYKDDEVMLKQELQDLERYYTDYLASIINEQSNLMLYNAEINALYMTDMADSWNESLLGRMYPDLESF
jgi:gas vesicle protein